MKANVVRERLLSVFPEQQATVLADTIIEAYDDLVKVSDFSELKAIAKELAMAQARTEVRVEELAVAQQRTEQRVEELTQAQQQTEKAVQGLARQVGGLSDTIGGDIEDIAYITLYDLLQREFGWQVGVLERTWHSWDRQPEEVDIFGQATAPEQPDHPCWIVGEAKHNLTLKEAQRFVRQLARARRMLTGDIFAVCFCYRARPEVQHFLAESGVYLAFSYRKLAPPTNAAPPKPAFWNQE
ncbi:MAG: hypothetical protein JXA33_11070 [Anaerolineae bacterium]|nr:hypothetical protein [Anaerolineae bacterium]